MMIESLFFLFLLPKNEKTKHNVSIQPKCQNMRQYQFEIILHLNQRSYHPRQISQHRQSISYQRYTSSRFQFMDVEDLKQSGS